MRPRPDASHADRPPHAPNTPPTAPPPLHRMRGLIRAATFAIALASAVVAAAQADHDAAGADREHVGAAPVALGSVPAWPLWVESGRGSTVTVLGADGALWFVDGSGQEAVRVARGLAGEQATPCGPAVLVVDERGSLRRLPRSPDLPVVSAIGPAVSRLHKPACAPDGGVLAIDASGALLSLTRELEPLASADVSALPDAELVVLDLGGGAHAVSVLTDPTHRYRHGTLGDEVEAASLTVLSLPDLEVLARWAPVAPAVIEARRPTPWSHGGASGLYVTVSDEGSGARLVRLAWHAAGLFEVASGEPLGASQRWLHLIGASGGAAYAVLEPRDGGPLVRYADAVAREAATPDDTLSVDVEPLATTPMAVGVTSHVDGERLLDRAAVVGRLEDGDDLLLVPSHDQNTMVWLRCDAVSCEVVQTVSLPAPLATNVALAPSGAHPAAVVLADRGGGVWWLDLPLPVAVEATHPPSER